MFQLPTQMRWWQRCALLVGSDLRHTLQQLGGWSWQEADEGRGSGKICLKHRASPSCKQTQAAGSRAPGNTHGCLCGLVRLSVSARMWAEKYHHQGKSLPHPIPGNRFGGIFQSNVPGYPKGRGLSVTILLPGLVKGEMGGR